MAEVVVPPTQRFVPGAPPPPPLSKSQKKKRKSVAVKAPKEEEDVLPAAAVSDTLAAAPVEATPGLSDVKSRAVSEEVVAQLELIPETTSAEKMKKASPVIELLNKRIKAQNKKISRIAVYGSKPSSELNEDQKRSLTTLPGIQGAVKELEETRKAIENLEAEEAKEKQRLRIEEEKAVNDRIAEAISDVTILNGQRVSALFSLIRLSAALSALDPTTFSISLNDNERRAIYTLTETLTNLEGPAKDDAIMGLLRNDGGVDEVSFERILAIVESYRAPVVESVENPEEPPFQEEVSQPQNDEVVTNEVEVVVEESDAVAETVAPANSSGSFHFMQESELETTTFEHDVEFVEKPAEADPVVVLEVADGGLPVIDTKIPPVANGDHSLEAPPVSAGFDWAADDVEGLPSINSLHAKFGTSGAATPEASSQDAVPVEDVAKEVAVAVNGHHETMPDPQVDEDGFVKAKSGRGRQSEARPEYRGRGRGGFKNDRGGGEHRGGFRGRGGGESFGGNWRGGDSEFRGRGGFRGGDRGRDFRGGDFRGRGGRGSGDFRGRGRGDKGGYRGRGGLEGGDAQPAS